MKQEHAVVVAGAGPVGMLLAGELALAGADVLIVERRPDQALLGSRAGGVQARAIELFDQRGIAERFLAEGRPTQVASFASVTIDISDFPTRHPYGLALFQNHIERILAAWLGELGVGIEYGREVTSLAQDESGVEIELTGSEGVRAEYLVGCDGGRSSVRRLAGFDFPGTDATVSTVIAEVELAEPPGDGVRDAAGVHGFYLMEDGKTFRIVTTDPVVQEDEPTLDDLKQALVAVFGTDYGVHNPTWISRFTNATRQAAAYRQGRVLLAGDAAHIHSPAGGQGLTIGFQDAVNLGWKLAEVVSGAAPASLLDTYHAERHPAGLRSLRYTMAQMALMRGESEVDALREQVAQLCRVEGARRLLGGLISGLDTAYDLGEGHPQLGRRAPDVDLVTRGGSMRLFALLHDARPLLLNLGAPGAIVAGPWSARVKLVDARFGGQWELPVIGRVETPPAMLVRPDGHVAWVGDGSSAGLEEALTKWLGPPIAGAAAAGSGASLGS